MKGISGSRNGKYAAMWVCESRAAWEKLWGTAARPLNKEDYPLKWKIWEGEILAPFLTAIPIPFEFTAYEELSGY